MDDDKRQRVRALINDTRDTLPHAARICANAGLPNLSAKLADLAERWRREFRRVGRPRKGQGPADEQESNGAGGGV